MNLRLLLDQIIHQNAVLIARLATVGGTRAPIAHVTNQLFFEISEELEKLGVTRKVGADMFGMALRSYLRKINRVGDSQSAPGRSLWEAVYAYIADHGELTRADIMRRFSRDDEMLMRGVLHDLAESGLVSRDGQGHDAVYSVDASAESRAADRADSTDILVWAAVYRQGPISREALEALPSIRAREIDEALARLMEDGRIHRLLEGDVETYHTDEFYVRRGDSVGWEAAVFDHYQSLVRTVVRKLTPEVPDDLRAHIGGSTYTFDISDDHPMREEALGLLNEFRDRIADLRERVEAHNDTEGRGDNPQRLVMYLGQDLMPEDEG